MINGSHQVHEVTVKLNTRLFSIRATVAGIALGILVSICTHNWLTRRDKPKPFGLGGGTMYFNRVLGQPFSFNGLEFDPASEDPYFAKFGTKIASTIRLRMAHSRRYDAWMIGFKPGMGWPFLSKAPSVDIYIDEYASDGLTTIAQHHYEAGPDGVHPVNFFQFCVNCVISSIICIPICHVVFSLLGKYLRHHRLRRRGFPVTVDHLMDSRDSHQ